MTSVRYTDAQIIEALISSAGIQSVAAELLERTYGRPYTRKAINKRIQNSTRLREILDDINEKVLDTAEGQLRIANGKGEPWAVQFILKTKGKHRGYTERIEQTGPGGGPVQHAVKVVTPQDMQRMSLDEIREFIRDESVGSGAD